MKYLTHNIRHIHMIGIKGQGMTALAELLIADGKYVTGSDTEEMFSTDVVLDTLGIQVSIFDKENITQDIDIIVQSSAYGENNVEMTEAMRRKIPIVLYGEVIADYFNAKRGILVTGTHGKTTTTAMTGQVLEDAGIDPTVLVGATVQRWGRNARVGNGEWIVAEGDEYQNKFLTMKPEILIVTSIEYDHPDFFKTKKQYQNAFLNIISSLPSHGLLIIEKGLASVIQKAPCSIVLYGISGKKEGRHMELNMKAVLAVAKRLHISERKAKQTLTSYTGTARRMEYYTSATAATVVIDDYAHHPTEIKTTLAAVRQRYKKRFITAVFQPHTYTRTHMFLRDFASSFVDADEVLLLPIYGSVREKREKFPGDLLTQLQKKITNTGKRVKIMRTLDDAKIFGKAMKLLSKKRVFITLGAGNGWEVARDVVREI
jgi:UDP-N-acetylmuramate--alanine ligase